MKFVGIDFSSHNLDVAILDIDTGHAEHSTLPLGPGDALTRLRRTRNALRSRIPWDDIALAAIEEPKGGHASSTIPLQRTLGAIVAAIPSSVDVLLLEPWTWRQALRMPGSGKRADLKARSVAYANANWPNVPDHLEDNAADAYCIATAALYLCERGAETAA